MKKDHIMDLKCEYCFWDKLYTCEIKGQKILRTHDYEINGQHINNKRYTSVINVVFNDCDIEELPPKLQVTFPNFRSLHIKNSRVNFIEREHLQEYSSLEKIYLHKSNFLFLSDDLLADLTALKCFSLSDNQIGLIEPNILDSLIKPDYVRFNETIFAPDIKLVHTASLADVKKVILDEYQKSAWKKILDKKRKVMEEKSLSDFCDSIVLRSVMDDLRNKYWSGIVIIEVRDESFKAHKAVLRAYSGVLYRMLEDDKTANQIVLEGISPSVFRIMIDFMYDGFLNVENIDLKEMLIASEKLECKSLTKVVLKSLMCSINSENALDLVVLSHEFGHAELREKALEQFTYDIKFKSTKMD